MEKASLERLSNSRLEKLNPRVTSRSLTSHHTPSRQNIPLSSPRSESSHVLVFFLHPRARGRSSGHGRQLGDSRAWHVQELKIRRMSALQLGYLNSDRDLNTYNEERQVFEKSRRVTGVKFPASVVCRATFSCTASRSQKLENSCRCI